jgi:hypothetical protein
VPAIGIISLLTVLSGHSGKRRGTFLKEGNAERPKPVAFLRRPNTESIPANHMDHQQCTRDRCVCKHGRVMIVLFVVHQNLLIFCPNNPVIVDCKIQGTPRFSSGQRASLLMDNDTISTIDPLGNPRRLPTCKATHSHAAFLQYGVTLTSPLA